MRVYTAQAKNRVKRRSICEYHEGMRLIHCAIPLCLNSLTLADDINPPLHSVPDAAINAEQMRLTRVIHQKITQTHAEEKQRNTQFAPFVATLRSGIEIQMQP
ncbi:hypothetical protein, partial [Rubritalea tangerina]|uniref:hypothetical protein n=1 Tax=Rubritalea tangerina TaxID=430798 RepID=UPI00360EE359